jgi:hypothetical protein
MTRWLARAVRLTYLVDRAYGKFDRLRSTLVAGFAPDRFFDAYNDLTYGSDSAYRPDTTSFRRGLFDWENEAITRFFPKPPARVLVGGAGGGREAFALVEKGYTVVAFDPAVALVEAMRARIAPGSDALRVYIGSYRSMPLLSGGGGGAPLNLATEAPSDAAVIGWASFSHLRSDDDCVQTLRQFARCTRGPILVSYFPAPSAAGRAVAGGGLKGWLKRRAGRRGVGVFSVKIGYYRLLSDADVDELIHRAGLNVIAADRSSNFPYFIVAGTAS